MNLEELRDIRDTILAHPDMETFARNVGHIISYLMSEQEKRIRLNMAIDKLSEQLTGREKDLAEQGFILRMMQQRSERNGKMLVGLVTSVGAIVVLELLRLALK